jgi:diamine N-acetyltransferase
MDNEASLNLFTTFGFQKIGVKKDWIYHNNAFHDEALFQLINHQH